MKTTILGTLSSSTLENNDDVLFWPPWFFQLLPGNRARRHAFISPLVVDQAYTSTQQYVITVQLGLYQLFFS